MNALHRYIVELRIYSGVIRGWCLGVAFKLSGFVKGRQYTATTIATLFFLHLCHYHFPFFRPIFCLVVFRALCAKTMNQCSATLLFYVCGASLIGFSCSWIQLTFFPFSAAELLFYVEAERGNTVPYFLCNVCKALAIQKLIFLFEFNIKFVNMVLTFVTWNLSQFLRSPTDKTTLFRIFCTEEV